MNINKSKTKVEVLGDQVRVMHSQSVRQAILYQSAETSYGIEFNIADMFKVEKALTTAKDLVEKMLAPKVREQTQMLVKLAEQNK